MSGYQSYAGRLKMVERSKNQNLEQLCKRIWIENGRDGSEFSMDEFCELSDKYIVLNGNLWKVLENEELDPDESFCRLVDNADGTVSFSTYFHNGGTCLEEMLDDAFKKHNK